MNSRSWSSGAQTCCSSLYSVIIEKPHGWVTPFFLPVCVCDTKLHQQLPNSFPEASFFFQLQAGGADSRWPSLPAWSGWRRKTTGRRSTVLMSNYGAPPSLFSFQGHTWCPWTAVTLSSSGSWREAWTGPSPRLPGRATGWM